MRYYAVSCLGPAPLSSMNSHRISVRVPRLLVPLCSFTIARALRSWNPWYSLVCASAPLLLVLARYGILEVRGGALGVHFQVENFKSTVACAGKVCMMLQFLCCCCEKLQHVHVELLLGYWDESVLAGVDLHNVVHRVVVLVVAYMQHYSLL